MIIKSSTELKDNYRELADLCIETGEPVFLTNNGEGELVLMSIQAWEEEHQRRIVEKALVKYESDKKNGLITYRPAKEVIAGLRDMVNKKQEGAKL